MKKYTVKALEYFLIFAGFTAACIFIYPVSDMFIFAADSEATLHSVLHESLFYGNGRLLGNILGFGFSHMFRYSFIFEAAILTLISYLLNRLVFGGNFRTAFLSALLIIFPGLGMTGESCYVLASFLNYVVPVFFLLASLCILKINAKNKFGFISALLLFIFTSAACLFSENTTITVLTCAILFTVYKKLTDGKAGRSSIVFVVSAFFGSALMFLIPRLTGTGHKLDYYRGVSDSVPALLTNAYSSFAVFTKTFSEAIPMVLAVSSALFILMPKISRKSGFLIKCVRAYLVFYPVFIIIYNILYNTVLNNNYLFVAQMFFTVGYTASVLIIILSFEKSHFRTKLILTYSEVLISAAPMLLVNQYGYRTYYITYAVLSVFALEALNEARKYIELGKSCKAALSVLFSAAFAVTGLALMIMSAYNFNCFAVRTEYIAEKTTVISEKIDIVPAVFGCISTEDEWPNTILNVVCKTRSEYTFVLKDSTEKCENADEYRIITEGSIPENISFAFSNFRFKDSDIVNKMNKK